MTDLAGIGDVLGKRLSGKGFDKVYFIVEIFYPCANVVWGRNSEVQYNFFPVSYCMKSDF